MNICKRILLFAVVFAVLPALVMSQDMYGTGNREMTVEESYLQQSVEMTIIQSLSRTDNRERKMEALDLIGGQIDRGNTGPEIRAALEYLAFEGTVNITRENGRIVNNNPDIRTRAAAYLGRIGTPEATNSLIRMVLNDNEPMVLTEAIKSLALIGINETGSNGRGETVEAISWIVNRYDRLNPDDLLALSALEAFEKIAEANGRIDREAIDTTIRIAEGPYNYRIRQRALITLNELRRYSR